MNQPIRLLAVEDSEDDFAHLLASLRDAGYDPAWRRVDTPEAMLAALDAEPWDVIIADYSMPRFSASAALALLNQRGLDIPFLIVSGPIADEAAVAAMRSGARDYVLKGNTARLIPAIDRELREFDERRRRKLAEEALAVQASFDPLTGLANRDQLRHRLHELVRAAAGGPTSIAVLVLDIDQFRDVNDSGGYEVGDVVLCQIAQRLRRSASNAAIIARLGGDEFAIVLDRSSIDAASTAAADLRRAIEPPFTYRSQSFALSCIIGIALHPAHGDDAETLLRRAEVALYAAKRTSAGFAFYDAARSQNGTGRQTILDELRQAITRQELELHYQPKVAMRSGALHGVEALIRWNHPTHGQLPAGRFIPLAEQSPLVSPLGRWVVDDALRQAAAWRRQGRSVRIAVNLSARTLHDAELPGLIASLLERRQAAPDWLAIEITESALMADPERVAGILRQLHDLGIRLSIDDFGTGYSSLAHLRQLTVDEIKIDRSFVHEIAQNENDLAIVRSTIDLGHNLGLEVVAEGIETQAVWDVLDSLGCDIAQGYLLSRPLPASELERWIDARR